MGRLGKENVKEQKNKKALSSEGDLNPHSVLPPADFTCHYSFHYQINAVSQTVYIVFVFCLWSGLCLYHCFRVLTDLIHIVSETLDR